MNESAMRRIARGHCIARARRQVTSPEANEHAYPIQFARQKPIATSRPKMPTRRALSDGLASSEM